MEKGIKIGELIRIQVDKAGIPITDFAKSMDKTRSVVYNIFEREDMSTDIVRKASKLLGHNFFQDLAEEYNAYNESKENLENDSKAVAQFFKIVPSILREMGRDSQIIFDEDDDHITPDLILPEYNITFTKGEFFKERIGENSLIKIVELHNDSGSVIELVAVLDRGGCINIKLDYKTKEEWRDVLEFAFSIIDQSMAEYNQKH